MFKMPKIKMPKVKMPDVVGKAKDLTINCLLYTSPSPRD